MVLALGAAASSAEEGPWPIVALSFEGDSADRTAFTRSLGELLKRLDVELTPRVTDAPLPKNRVIAEISADWTSPTEATVTIVDAQQRVVLVRRLARSGSAQLVIEAAAHISHSVIEELISPSAVPPPLVTVVEVSTPQALPAAVETAGPLGVELSGFFGGRAQAPTAPIALGGGVALDVTLTNWRLKPGLLFSGEYQAPSQPGTSGVGFVRLNVQSVVLRLGPKLTLAHGETWRIDTGAAGGADVFITRPSADHEPPGGFRSRVDVSAMITGLIGGHLAVARTADVWLALTIDVDLIPRRFRTTEGTVLFEPWPVRPALMLGFSFSAAGAEPYASRAGGGS